MQSAKLSGAALPQYPTAQVEYPLSLTGEPSPQEDASLLPARRQAWLMRMTI